MSHLKFSKLFRSNLGSFVKHKTSYKFPLQQLNPTIFSYRKISTMQVIHTDDAPQALGPYSQAIKANGFVFVSGQIPIVPADGSIPEDIVSQTNQVLVNLKEVLLAAGADLSSVVKTTVFLKDMNDFVAMNKVYEERFGSHRPARAAIEVARLPKDVKVEIECVALAQ